MDRIDSLARKLKHRLPERDESFNHIWSKGICRVTVGAAAFLVERVIKSRGGRTRIGNTKAIAAGHYLQVTDADWTRATASGEAAANPATQAPQSAHKPDQSKTQNPQNLHEFVGVGVPCDAVESEPMGRTGLEPATLAFSMRCSTN